MSKWFLSRGMCAALVLLAVFAMLPKAVTASHVWSTYHWRRPSAAILNIPVRRVNSAVWVARYNTAMTDWRKPAMTKIKPFTGFTGGQAPSCPVVNGQITSCDGSYGGTGWLGLAQIWISGSHILRGRSIMNNSYFALAAYNTIPWRQLVMCQEIGHNFGLGHVNVVFGNRNVGSCMDYTSDPDGGGAYGPSNMHPYAHDYALINTKHTHVGMEPPTLLSGPENSDLPEPTVAEPQRMVDFNGLRMENLGQLMYSGDGGRTERYESDFGGGHKVVTQVVWAGKKAR